MVFIFYAVKPFRYSFEPVLKTYQPLKQISVVPSALAKMAAHRYLAMGKPAPLEERRRQSSNSLCNLLARGRAVIAVPVADLMKHCGNSVTKRTRVAV